MGAFIVSPDCYVVLVTNHTVLRYVVIVSDHAILFDEVSSINAYTDRCDNL